MKLRTKLFLLGFVLVGVGAVATACSPGYILKAGMAEAEILRARRPIPDVILDPSTDADTREKLLFALEARRFAIEELGMEVGDAYTSFVQLEKDTLAMVLSAVHRDRFVSKTWWFPVVGRVPYKGFFDLEDAQRAQRDLEAQGFDTYLRPTAAFSTLGWFDDPLLSTFLRFDTVELVETLLHEMSHANLWIPGNVRFNESYAQFVGRAAAIEFFCQPEVGEPDVEGCRLAQDRWKDYQRFSWFMDGLIDELEALYSDPDLTAEVKLQRREEVFATSRTHFVETVQPGFVSTSFGGFLASPINNATLLSRLRYYHRLPDFDAYWKQHPGLRSMLQTLGDAVAGVEDPFSLLPTTGTEHP